MTAASSSSFTYDANGNMLTRPGQTLAWDAENRLSQVVSGTVTTTLAYDGDGKRVLLAEPAGVTLFVSAGYEVFIPAASQAGGITATIYPTMTYRVYFPLVLGCDYRVAGQPARATKYYFANGQRVAMRAGCPEAPTYLYQDHLGGTAATDGGQSLRYYPYGATRSGTVSTTYQFTGQKLDTGTGLYYYGARYYDPVIGRFVSADSIVPSAGSPQDLNRYAYTRNNPVRYTDPSGNDPLDQAWQDEFARVHGRPPGAEDIVVRLYSIAFPATWNWSAFYDEQDKYRTGSTDEVLRPDTGSPVSWDDMPGALNSLQGWYSPGEEENLARDVGTLFGGLPNRAEQPSGLVAISDRRNPVRTWAYVNAGSMPLYLTGTSDKDTNIHHWGWAFALGYELGPVGLAINTAREGTQFTGDFLNSGSDVLVGNSGVAMGTLLRVSGLANVSWSWAQYIGRWPR